VRTIALVPAFDEEERIGATVLALMSISRIDGVVVVDAGSSDRTAAAAAAAGARVVAAPRRLGKGDALEAGLERTDRADAYVLADADLGASAAGIEPLLDEVEQGRADMAIAVLPSPPTGGFGLMKRLARALIRATGGLAPREPLSGQRALTGRCLQSCRPLASGFGVEVGLTADAARLGFRMREIPVQLEHRYTRKDLAGFLHRGRQGLDATRAAAPRMLRLR
jgi:glycosyltransferase involved in cell wall biosynthesis